ncbi:hypothetical protein TSUD_341520 [Trifolium subterraneum]|uniref:Reverse transcriptase domain-containing protein n=1 Tax=Trifolium subterraneum TaxID=3900 RepID=A0A2Z6MHL0_TRISU|nr:hypothetical protein TSUD_341520 [Trifolium subterraneum]
MGRRSRYFRPLSGKKAYVVKEKLKMLKESLKTWNTEVFGILDLNIEKIVQDLNNVEGLLDSDDVVVDLVRRDILDFSCSSIFAPKRRKSFTPELGDRSQTNAGKRKSSLGVTPACIQLFKGYPKAAQWLYLFVKQHTATLQLNNSYSYAPLLKARRRNFGDQSQTDLFSSKYMSCHFAELLAVIFKLPTDILRGQDSLIITHLYIEKDVMEFLNEFRRNATLPKAITTSFLALVPKKDHPQIGLTGLMQKAVELEKFKGFKVNNNLNFHILQFADDTIIVGEGDWDNLYLEAASAFLSCSIDRFPFRFLGLPVGANPRRVSTWRLLIETTRKRLSGWSGRHLSIGETFLSRLVVSAKRTDSLWWRDILKVGGLEGDLWFSSNVSSILEDSKSIGFWKEKWIGNNSLIELFPNLFEMEQDKNVVVANKGNWEADGWSWFLFQEGLLTGTDEQEAAMLYSLLANYHPFDRHDKRKWIPDASGRFSVRSTYQFLKKL